MTFLEQPESRPWTLHIKLVDIDFGKSEERATWKKPFTVLRCEVEMMGSKEKSFRVVGGIFYLHELATQVGRPAYVLAAYIDNTSSIKFRITKRRGI